ncbi:MAG: hypothetical protein KatS3mg060_1578 [Dehalococcoidia bacterium]|nr:MAG: hypothetical protein KatS3mg060_1578 [Dehalococcoidia bacterium]
MHVTFFDGNPKRGGSVIGAQVLPLVWAGRSAEATVTWPTARKFGQRELFARVRWFSPEHGSYADNLVRLTVNLPPWPSVSYVPGSAVRPVR